MRSIVGALRDFPHHAAGFTRCCAAWRSVAPLSAPLRHLGRRGSWFSRRVGGLSGVGSALVVQVQVRARAGACSAVGGGVALAWGAVRLLAGLPWSLSHSWARSQLLRLWSPRESDRGLVGGGEWPRFLVALRSWSLADSTALVKGNLLRQWGRHDAAPRGREAPGMARTGLGFPPKSPPSGGSGPGVGLGRSWVGIGVGNGSLG